MNKKLILVVLLVILIGGIAAVFITDRVEQQDAERHEAMADAAVQETQLNDGLKNSELDLIEITIGPLAREDAEAKCYGKPASCVEALPSYKKARSKSLKP